jgi:uncharacterized metal-binding protein
MAHTCAGKCAAENQYGTGTLIFGCSGGSDVGGLSDLVARRLAKDGKGKMYCLAGLGGDVTNMVTTAKEASARIVIDGCPVACAKKILDAKGLSYTYFNLKEFGYEKGKVAAPDQAVAEVVGKMGLSDA